MSITTVIKRRRALAALTGSVASLCLASGAFAAVPTATTISPTEAAAGWLSTQFSGPTNLPQPGGDHFGSTFSGTYYPDYGTNADVIFGLAAAKSGASTIATAINALEANIKSYADPDGTNYGPYDGSLAKAALAAMVAGKDPTNFGGYNLLQILKKDECADSTKCTVGSPANIYSQFAETLVILAEARAGGTYAPSAAAIDYLLSFQCADGGFTDNTDAKTYALLACGSAQTSNPDTTAFAVMALQAVGGHQAEINKAVSWLESQEVAGKYWVSQGAPNVDSTGAAAAALAGQGKDVSGPQAWLATQQIPAGQPGAGALRYAGGFKPTTTSATSMSVLATAQGLLGLGANGSLATLTASGAAPSVSMFAPTSALSASSAEAAKSVTVTGRGFAAGERVQIALHSTPVTLATVTAGSDGSVSAAVTIPASAAVGAHNVVLTGLSSGLSAASSLTLTAPAASVVGVKANTGGSVTASGGSENLTPIGLAGVGLLSIAGGLGLVTRRRAVLADTK